MSGSGRKAIPNVLEWSVGPPGWPVVVRSPYKYPGVVERPSQMSGNGRETFPNVRELSRDTPGSLKVVGGPLDVREWSGVPP